MNICNIYPIANQSSYMHEDYVMILAHLVKQGLYNPDYFNGEDQYIIMDNGLYEKAQVSTSLQDCIDIAEKSNIPVSEIIVPDIVNDLHGTIKCFTDNLFTMLKYEHKYRFMFVAQCKTYKEMAEAFRFAHQISIDSKISLSIGISKLCKLDRAHPRALKLYRESKLPIHFLGIKTTFKELEPVHNLIRTCDTSQLAYIVKNEHSSNLDILNYTRNGVHPDIDLDKDTLDEKILLKLIYEERKQLNHVIL